MLIRFPMAAGSQAGTVLTELVMVLPVLLMLGFGAIEFGAFNNQYLVLTQIAREGVRDAAQRPGLEMKAVADPSDPLCSCPVHAEVHTRLRTVLTALEKQKVLRADQESVKLTSKRSGDGRTVSLKLEMPNPSLLGSLFGLTIRQESVVSYLVDFGLFKVEHGIPLEPK